MKVVNVIFKDEVVVAVLEDACPRKFWALVQSRADEDNLTSVEPYNPNLMKTRVMAISPDGPIIYTKQEVPFTH